MRGTLIAGNTITHMGLFAGLERSDQVYPPLIEAGIIVPCKLAPEECEKGCRWHRDSYGPRYHMGDGFEYRDFKEAARRLHQAVLDKEAIESDARVTDALKRLEQ